MPIEASDGAEIPSEYKTDTKNSEASSIKTESPNATEQNLTAPNSPLQLASLFGQRNIVSMDIPSWNIVTVELINPARIQALHDKRCGHLIEELKPNIKSGDQ
ncbi:hypothetical protein BDV06DRAFT_217979 [Aspergillus oleicola]